MTRDVRRIRETEIEDADQKFVTLLTLSSGFHKYVFGTEISLYVRTSMC